MLYNKRKCARVEVKTVAVYTLSYRIVNNRKNLENHEDIIKKGGGFTLKSIFV